MLLIDDKLISDDVIEVQFICNLTACKGACCVQGDLGAPLAEEELGILDDIYDEVEPYLTEKGKAAIAEQGRYVFDSEEDGWGTPLIDGAACAYVNYDALGVAQCGIQQAYNKGEINWMKPVSCHLYPIRTERIGDYEAINYNKWSICKAACTLGKEHQVPVYEFLKEPLVRKYGAEFYKQLDAAAKRFLEEKEK